MNTSKTSAPVMQSYSCTLCGAPTTAERDDEHALARMCEHCHGLTETADHLEANNGASIAADADDIVDYIAKMLAAGGRMHPLAVCLRERADAYFEQRVGADGETVASLAAQSKLAGVYAEFMMDRAGTIEKHARLIVETTRALDAAGIPLSACERVLAAAVLDACAGPVGKRTKLAVEAAQRASIVAAIRANAERLAEYLPSMCFTVESVAHLCGRERDLLPMCDEVRRLMGEPMLANVVRS